MTQDNDPLKIFNKNIDKCYNNSLDFTCLSEQDIYDLVHLFNTIFCDENQNFCLDNKRITIKNKSIKNIYEELKQKLVLFYDNSYTDETKWKKIKQFKKFFLKKKTTNIPKMPFEWCSNIEKWRTDNNDAPWLSNYDIDAVLQKYEKKYKDFKFLGSVPIDFRQKHNSYDKCILDIFSFKKSWLKKNNTNYCQFNPDFFDKNNKYFGIVFNTDNHIGSGKHWMSMFISINPNNPCILFFDSACTYLPPHQEIMSFIEHIKQTYPHLNFTILNNTVKHQQSNSECGMYSLYFILTMMDSEKTDNYNCISCFKEYFNNKINKKKIEDKTMILYRSKLFELSCKK